MARVSAHLSTPPLVAFRALTQCTQCTQCTHLAYPGAGQPRRRNAETDFGSASISATSTHAARSPRAKSPGSHCGGGRAPVATEPVKSIGTRAAAAAEGASATARTRYIESNSAKTTDGIARNREHAAGRRARGRAICGAHAGTVFQVFRLSVKRSTRFYRASCSDTNQFPGLRFSFSDRAPR